jgi:hypothetical protein
MKLLSKKNYARNLLVELIKFDKEMHKLYIPYIKNNSLEKELLEKINKFRRNEPDMTSEGLQILRKSMNKELNSCLKRIDGYPPYH